MDCCYSWLAIQGLPAEVALATLNLRRTTESVEPSQAEYSFAQRDGDVLVASRRFDYADQAALAELSAAGPVTTCCVNEPLTYSSASRWQNGRRMWYFFHDGSIGIQHMHTEGELPVEYHAIANRLTVTQAEGEGLAISVDQVFEVAPQVAEALVGFRYDGESTPRPQFIRLTSH